MLVQLSVRRLLLIFVKKLLMSFFNENKDLINICTFTTAFMKC